MVINGIFSYKSYVDKDSIEIIKKDAGEYKYRYLLSVNFTDASSIERPLVVIMKNPSCADENNSDRTVNNILKFAHENNYTKVHILNLYSLYSTDSKKIKYLVNGDKKLVAVGEDNDKVIKETIENVEDIIIAWGTSPKGMKRSYKERVEEVLRFFKDKNLYYVLEDYHESLYPRHPQVWASDAADLKLEPWNGGSN